MSKPTLSALIKKMREKGYLYFLADPDDVRKKKVLPTAKLIAEGEEVHAEGGPDGDRDLQRARPEGTAQLWNLEQKLHAQLARMEHGN